MKFAIQPDKKSSPSRSGYAATNVPFWGPNLVWAPVLLCCAAVLVWSLAGPKEGSGSRTPRGQFQADVRTLAAALRYLSEPERDETIPFVSNSALVQPLLSEKSNSVAHNYPSNRAEIPGKVLTRGCAHS